MKPNPCWLARLDNAGPCEGALVKCHLISKAQIKRTFPKGAVRIDGQWERPVEARFLPEGFEPVRRTLRELQEDERAWVWGCGGLVGISGHHGRLDTAPHERTRLRIPRLLLPPEVEEYAAELGLGYWLDKTYGELTNDKEAA